MELFKWISIISTILVHPFIVLAQTDQGAVSLVWKTETRSDPYGVISSSLTFDNAKWVAANPLPQWVLQTGGAVDKIILTNQKFEKINQEELSFIDTTWIKTSTLQHIDIGYQRKRPVSLVSVLPFRYDSIQKNYYKLTSFNYRLTFKSTESRSSARIAATQAENSVLSKGEWHKLEISSGEESTGSGLYKIDYAQLNTILGSKISTIDPRKIRIYGNGGAMLPEPSSTPRAKDLLENSILVVGEQDGKFDQGDYIVFYAHGPDTWEYDNRSKTFGHIKNIYSDQTYYFLTVSDSLGKRVQQSSDTGTASIQINSYKEKLFHEKDAFNLIKSGRDWFGEEFDAITSRDFTFSLEGKVADAPVQLYSSVMGTASSPSTFTLSNNGKVVRTFKIDGWVKPYGKYGDTDGGANTITGLTNNLVLTLKYSKPTNNAAAKGFLDYFEVNYEKILKLYGSQTSFTLPADPINFISQINIAESRESQLLWDVTSPGNALQIPLTYQGSSASAVINTEGLRTFVIFEGDAFPSPRYVGQVANQNLHAIGTAAVPDLIIVTPDVFESAAGRLADFRRSHDHLDVEVVTTSKIYNEFGSGAQDLVAIRDFVKMVYDRNNGSDSLSYLLLFGSASYDYKNRIANNTNYVPIYETPESLDKVASQSSDDYCGLLDDKEGAWDVSGAPTEYMDIGVGRLTIKSAEEATAVVNKLISYGTSPEALGKWRNYSTLVADNKDYGTSFAHMDDAELMATTIKGYTNSVNIEKLYMDAFPLVSTPSGQSCPAIKDALLKGISTGSLLINYSGHGSEEIWGQENIFQNSDIDVLKNKYRLPFFITATCDFGVYDDPAIVSGAMRLVLNPDGGAVGILSSTRPVYQTSNADLNRAFYKEVFNFKNNQKPRLGDIMMGTKNNSVRGKNNRNYALLADPSMMLAYPDKNIVITAVNDKSSSAPDTLNSLAEIKVSGEIRNVDVLDANFNGTVNISVFDKESIYRVSFSDAADKTFRIQDNLIFEGTTTVKNGVFSISFKAPKDISYNFGFGKISLYAQSTSGDDAAGNYTNIVIGGVNPDQNISDNQPPIIKPYINDSTFRNGSITGPNPVLIVKLSDESGINISSSGIGHEITAVMNNSKEVLILNNFYNSSPEDITSGKIEYPFFNLAPGNYTIRIKAWDIYNNSSEQEISFVVADKPTLEIVDAGNHPNPFSETTDFTFDHNKSGEDLEVTLLIYNLSGVVIGDYTWSVVNSPSHVTFFSWSGRDAIGMPLPPGAYTYRLGVTSKTDGSVAVVRRKLIIVN